MDEVRFRATVKSLAADAGKVEVRLLVDPSDVSAHEGLVSLRGRDVIASVSPVQERMEFEDEQSVH